MKKLTKVASVMLCGAVVSACSLAFLPTLHAAADVPEGQISPLSAVTPPNPSVETKQFNGMVRYRYTAEQCRYLWLSDTTAFTDGICLDMQGTGYAVYKEAKIPIAGRYTESSYRFAKSRHTALQRVVISIRTEMLGIPTLFPLIGRNRQIIQSSIL